MAPHSVPLIQAYTVNLLLRERIAAVVWLDPLNGDPRLKPVAFIVELDRTRRSAQLHSLADRRQVPEANCHDELPTQTHDVLRSLD